MQGQEAKSAQERNTTPLTLSPTLRKAFLVVFCPTEVVADFLGCAMSTFLPTDTEHPDLHP